MDKKRRDLLKGMVALPLLGYFVYGARENITKELSLRKNDYLKTLKIDRLQATEEKLRPPTGENSQPIRLGLIGNGWRGDQLLRILGFIPENELKGNILPDGSYTAALQKIAGRENLNVEIRGICDTFEIHAQRGLEVSKNYIHSVGKRMTKPAKLYPTYREMIADDEIDAVIIATPDHTHAPMAIAAAQKGKHVYLEKPMTHSIEEAVELRNVIKSTGVVFQLGHENRQQMSYKIARELYLKGALGVVSMAQTYTNKNGLYGAWIREREFDHLGTIENINWEEFQGNAPWREFDRKRYFNWHRYSEYGTSVTGNDFSHKYDCVNQILGLGIPEQVIAMAGQYYYFNHGDMPDLISAVCSYPEQGLILTYDSTLKSGIYRQSRIMGSEATIDIDNAILMYKDEESERYQDLNPEPEDKPMYYYSPASDVDAISSATSRAYIKGGYGPTFIDGKVIESTFLHLKEWIDAIRGKGETSGHIDTGFEEAVTFNLINLAYTYGKPVRWDRENEKAIIG
ncbi:MAG: Gfo/Idh/MocA family oxidoreductase [Tannerellaceae bacterium]|jgi:predicted dehydrogenase|nr:Gfo/Idh/MocA family oxidoreductase [Tannerellaceae bacterium]